MFMGRVPLTYPFVCCEMIESLTKRDLRLVLLGAGCSKCDCLGNNAGWLPIISL